MTKRKSYFWEEFWHWAGYFWEEFWHWAGVLIASAMIFGGIGMVLVGIWADTNTWQLIGTGVIVWILGGAVLKAAD